MAAGARIEHRPGSLARFQDAFERALLNPDATPDAQVAALTRQRAFAVYRNTVISGCIDALQANYPAVARLVGEQWFRAAASVFARQTPPTGPTLLHYGAEFAGFLAGFGPASELPYLPDVARLDRFWSEAHVARNDSVLDPRELAKIAAKSCGSVALRPHAAARWAWFPAAPVYSIWSRNRSSATFDGDLEWKPEGALLVRCRDAVEWTAIDAAGCAFLDACAQGRALLTARRAALAVRHDTDLASLTNSLLLAGAFSQLRTSMEKSMQAAGSI